MNNNRRSYIYHLRFMFIISSLNYHFHNIYRLEMFDVCPCLLLALVCIFMQLPSSLTAFTSERVYQNPNILIINSTFNQNYISIIAADITKPADKYLYNVDINTFVESSPLTIDTLSAKLAESTIPDSAGNYYYIIVCYDPNSPDLRVTVYDRDTMGMVTSWGQQQYYGVEVIFGEDQNTIYILTQYDASYQIKKLELQTRNLIASTTQTEGVSKSIYFQPQTRKIISFAITQGASTQWTIITIYDLHLNIIHCFRQEFQLQETPIIAISNLYIGVGSGFKITIYDIQSALLLWDVTLESDVVSLQLVQRWVIARSPGRLWQIGPNGLIMSTIGTQYDLGKVSIITSTNGYEAIVWGQGGSLFERFIIDDFYDCDASLGCQCATDYCFVDASQLLCNYTGTACTTPIQTTNTTTNSSANTSSPINSSALLNTTTNTSTNTTDSANTSTNTSTNTTALNENNQTTNSTNTINSTINNTINSPTNSSSLNSTANNTINNTVNSSSINNTINSSTNSTLNNSNNPINSTANNTVANNTGINYGDNSTNGVTNNVTITEFRENVDPCLFRNQDGVCIVFCNMMCGTCLSLPQFCLTCRSPYYQLQPNGECVPLAQAKTISVIVNSLNNIKISGAQPLYLFLDRFELYNYHATNYTGIMQGLLSVVDFSKQYFWTVISSKKLQSWMQSPISLPSYISFTPTKFQEIERKDALLIQNTKDYFLIYLPLSSAIFIILNRLFYALRSCYVSSFIRTYSFWLQLWAIVVIQNLSMLWYFCCNELTITFSFNTEMYWMRMITVPLIGLIFVFSVAFYFMAQYFYGRLCKYFVVNMKKFKFRNMLMLIRYVLKPIVESSFTSIFERSQTLLISLTISQLCTIIILVGFELRYNIFVTKWILFADCMVQFLMMCLNILLLLKYSLYPELQIFTEPISLILYLLVFWLVLLIILSIFTSLFSCNDLRCKKKNTDAVDPPSENKSKLKVQYLDGNIFNADEKAESRVKFYPKAQKLTQLKQSRKKK